MNPALNFGFRIIEDPSMTVPGDPITVTRTWKERLWTWPWRPFQKTKTIVPQVPSPQVFMTNNMMIMHPTIAQQLRNNTRIQSL